MTAPKDRPRRLGFAIDAYGRTVAGGRDGVWSDDARAFARWVYLHTLARIDTGILADLAQARPENPAALSAWLEPRHLVSADPEDDWTAAHARASLQGWAQYPNAPRVWWDRDDVSGVYCDAPQPALGSRPLKDDVHFEWLARFQTGEAWGHIAARHGSAAAPVRDRAHTLARQLGLVLRPVHRGRPKL